MSLVLRPSARRRGTLAVASALALAAAAVPALAGCGSASVFSCGVRNDSIEAVPVSATSITTVLLPRGDNEGLSNSLYDALVPAGFLPAADKQIAVQVTRYDVGRCQPTAGTSGAPAVPAAPCRTAAQAGTTSWVEGTVALKVTRNGDTGWLPLSSAYGSARELAAATAVGIPGYAAQGDVVATATTAKGTATKAGAPTITLDWAKSSTFVSGAVFDLAQGIPSVFSTTPGTPATHWRTSRNLRPTAPVTELVAAPNSSLVQPGVTSTGSPVRGDVRVQLAPVPLAVAGRTLADLVSLESDSSGVVRQEDGLLVTKRDNLTDGKDGPLPKPPASQAVILTGPGAQATSTGGLGFLAPLTTMTEGGTLTFANLDPTAEHTVTALRSGPDGQPLFDAIAAGVSPEGNVTVTQVKGVSSLKPDVYDFVCALHSSMTGKLLVV